MFPTYYTNTGVCTCVAIKPLKWHLNVYRRNFLSSVRFPPHCRFSNLKKVWYGLPHDLPALPKFVYMLELPGDLLKIPKPRPHYRRMKSQSLEMGPRHLYFFKLLGDSTMQTSLKTTVISTLVLLLEDWKQGLDKASPGKC